MIRITNYRHRWAVNIKQFVLFIIFDVICHNKCYLYDVLTCFKSVRSLYSHISDLSEGLPAWAILDGLDGHGDLHRLSLWSPKALKHNQMYSRNHISSQPVYKNQAETIIAHKWVDNLVQEDKEFNQYFVHCAKNSRAKGLDFFQLWGPQDASMNLGAFFSRTQWLKALQKMKAIIPRCFFLTENKCM